MDEVMEGMLNVPIGDELKDPRGGEYEGTLSEVKIEESKNGNFALALKFTGMVDQEGRNFDFTHQMWIPTSESSDGHKRMFLADLHNVGLVPREDKRSRVADAEEHRESLRGAAASKIGVVYPFVLRPDKEDRIQLRFRRPRSE